MLPTGLNHYNRNTSNLKSTTTTKRKIYLFTKTNSHELFEFLQHAHLNSSHNSACLAPSVNSMWSTLAEILRETCNKFIPFISIPYNTSSPRYFTPEIRHQLNIIRSLKRSIQINPTPHRTAKLSMLERNLHAGSNRRHQTCL